MDLCEDVVEALRNVLGRDRGQSLHEPTLSGNEKKYLTECIDTTYVSSIGKFVDRFEDELAFYTGSRHVVAVVNGTEALHVSLLLAGIAPDDEVLIPSLTFVGTANAVAYCGATPHFIDNEVSTLGVNAEAVRDWLAHVSEMRSGTCINRYTGNPIRAIVPVHVFGHPCDLDGLMSVAHDFKLAIVEDAAESLGSWYEGRHTGTIGKLGILSFNGNKTITTGGGGAILTDDTELAVKAKHLTTTAKVPHPWEYIHEEIGFNYRMPNLNAAVGCAQLEQLGGMLKSKRRLFERYQAAFKAVCNVSVFEEPEGCQSNYWLQTLVLEPSVTDKKNDILKATNSAGIMTRPAWQLLHTLKPFQACPRAPLPTSESLAKRVINIPSSAGLV